jgi:hypothetical protein
MSLLFLRFDGMRLQYVQMQDGERERQRGLEYPYGVTSLLK